MIKLLGNSIMITIMVTGMMYTSTSGDGVVGGDMAIASAYNTQNGFQKEKTS